MRITLELGDDVRAAARVTNNEFDLSPGAAQMAADIGVPCELLTL